VDTHQKDSSVSDSEMHAANEKGLLKCSGRMHFKYEMTSLNKRSISPAMQG